MKKLGKKRNDQIETIEAYVKPICGPCRCFCRPVNLRATERFDTDDMQGLTYTSVA